MLSNVADFLSIVGFLTTIYVAFTVRSIQRSYKKRAFVETCLPKLKAASKNIRRSITRADEVQLRAELRRCKAIVSQLIQYSQDLIETRNSIAVIERTAGCRGVALLSGCEDVLEVLAGETEKLELLKVEIHWSYKDG